MKDSHAKYLLILCDKTHFKELIINNVLGGNSLPYLVSQFRSPDMARSILQVELGARYKLEHNTLLQTIFQGLSIRIACILITVYTSNCMIFKKGPLDISGLISARLLCASDLIPLISQCKYKRTVYLSE